MRGNGGSPGYYGFSPGSRGARVTDKRAKFGGDRTTHDGVRGESRVKLTPQ